jgi:hypothetical protein
MKGPDMTTPQGNHPIRDEAAKLAANAWPIYQALGWHWRERPVTEARLALEIREGIQILLDNPDQEEWGTGGLQLRWENEDEDRELHLDVSVNIGSIKPGDAAQMVRWPNTPATAGRAVQP